jgi:hypothetical protein
MRTSAILLSLSLLAVAIAAGPARAADDRACKHSSPQSLALDIGDARAVEFHVGPSMLRLDGTPGASGSLKGRACASSTNELGRLRLEQSREGERLVVRLVREERDAGWSFGNHYAYFDLSGSIPDGMPVDIRLGSGDTWITGVAALALTVGSGDVDARNVRGRVDVRLGSGDVVLADIGSLDGGAIGSGDLEARGIRGDARVSSLGSGDVDLSDVGGDVDIGSVGSGDVDIERVRGGVSVGSVGSGGIGVDGIGGDFRVRSMGSGSVAHDSVAGKVDLPRKR